MTVLFSGGEMGAFIPSDSAVSEDTSHTYWSSSFARCAIECPRDTNYIEGVQSATATDVWIRFDMASDAISSSTLTQRFVWYDASAVARVRMNYAGTNLLQVEYYNGAWTAAGSTIALNMSQVRQTFDIHVVCNTASGSINLYVAGTNRINSGTIDLSATTSLETIRFYGSAPSGLTTQSWPSQVVITTGESTIGNRLMTVVATGTGATDQMTGTYTSIDETDYLDSDFIWSDTADQVELFSGTPVGSLSGYTVRGVTVTARANTDGTGPTQIQMALRTGGTTYFSGSLALDAGMGAFQYTWETNPNTTLPWTAAEAAAIQFGVKSIA